jgi:hypothetical protein
MTKSDKDELDTPPSLSLPPPPPGGGGGGGADEGRGHSLLTYFPFIGDLLVGW